MKQNTTARIDNHRSGYPAKIQGKNDRRDECSIIMLTNAREEVSRNSNTASTTMSNRDIYVSFVGLGLGMLCAVSFALHQSMDPFGTWGTGVIAGLALATYLTYTGNFVCNVLSQKK